MRVILDVDQMRGCIDLWRYTLAIRPGRNDSRAAMLRTIAHTVDGWLSVLPLLIAEGDDARQLENLLQEVRQFKHWVDEGRMALQLVAEPAPLTAKLAAVRGMEDSY